MGGWTMTITDITSSGKSKYQNDGHKDVLALHHLNALKESGITQTVIEERGYRTITKNSEMVALGFSRAQSVTAQAGNVLLIPLRSVSGEINGYIARPDSPRIDPKSGKPRKYEFPPTSRQILDVPAGCRDKISDPTVPLFVTEGAKKADAAVSAGLTCIDLAGVWNWRGSNEVGGKTALGDWESVALNDRQVYIVFDSDVTIKVGVWLAASRLGEFLRSRHASVSYIILPPLDDGNKCGLDDWLASGNTPEHLPQLAVSALPPIGGITSDLKPILELDNHTGHWIATNTGIFQEIVSLDPFIGEPTTSLKQLAYFGAQITAVVTRDDGIEKSQKERIKFWTANRAGTIEADGVELAEHPERYARKVLGPGAVIPTKVIPRLVGEAIALLSDTVEIPWDHIYTHIGWHQINNEVVYLHGGGGIGASGSIASVSTELPTSLGEFILPSPPDDLSSAIQSVLRLLDVAPDPIIVPLLAAVFRAPIGGVDWSLALSGHTGVRKSTLAALAQAFWMPSARYDHLPASFHGTANSLADLQFLSADALLVVDDFAPQASDTNQIRQASTTDRLVRGASNHQSRTRMRADGTLRPDRPPRCLTVLTGEQDIDGESLRARTITINIRDKDIPINDHLASAQADAASGVFAGVMALWIQYIARQTPTVVQKKLGTQTYPVPDTGHSRANHNLVEVLDVWSLWLNWATEIGAIDIATNEQLFDRVSLAVEHLVRTTRAQVADATLATQYISLLASGLASGEAYLLPSTGRRLPTEAPTHTVIGWLSPDGTEIWLDPIAAMAVAREIGCRAGRPLVASSRAVSEDLARSGLLLSNEAPGHLTALKTVAGHRRRVLVLNSVTLLNGE